MPAFLALFVANFLFGVSINATSLLPPYLASLGATQAYIGFYSVVGTLMLVLAVVLFGRPLVRLPRVRALRWGYVLLLVGSALSWWFSTNLVLLAILRALGSISLVFSWTLLMSLLYDLVPAHKRASSVALFGVAGLLTNPLASLVGEWILRSWGGPGLFVFAAGFAVASWAWSFVLVEPSRPEETVPPGHFHELLAKKELWPLFLLSFVFGVFFSALMSFLPHQTQQTLGEPNLSAFLVPFSLVSVVLRIFMGPQLDRHPPRWFLLLSFGSLVAGMAVLLLPAHWGWVMLAGVFYGVGHSTLFPLLSALFVQAGGEEQKAVYSNAYLVANLTGAVLMTPLLGAMGDLWGFASIAVSLLVMALFCWFLVLFVFGKPAASPPSDRSS